MSLAKRCQIHLANATATNSPSRKYSIILEGLKSEAIAQRPADSRAMDLNNQAASACLNNATAMDATALPASNAYDTSGIMQAGLAEGISGGGYNPFMDWQTSDWLELDASVCLSVLIIPIMAAG